MRISALLSAVTWWYRSAFYYDPSIPEVSIYNYRSVLFTLCGNVLNSTGYDYPYYQASGGNYYVLLGGMLVVKIMLQFW